MVRGHAKAQAQAKNLKNAPKEAKSQMDARKVAMKLTCPICKLQMANYGTLKIHYDGKHPKETVPSEESCKT